jgi:hypothetical protein
VIEQKEITLDKLTSALKTFYGQETEAVRLILLHWAKNSYDLAQATPELLREIEGGWPAPSSADTELGVLMEPEVGHGETEVYTGVQA